MDRSCITVTIASVEGFTIDLLAESLRESGYHVDIYHPLHITNGQLPLLLIEKASHPIYGD